MSDALRHIADAVTDVTEDELGDVLKAFGVVVSERRRSVAAEAPRTLPPAQGGLSDVQPEARSGSEAVGASRQPAPPVPSPTPLPGPGGRLANRIRGGVGLSSPLPEGSSNSLFQPNGVVGIPLPVGPAAGPGTALGEVGAFVWAATSGEAGPSSWSKLTLCKSSTMSAQ